MERENYATMINVVEIGLCICLGAAVLWGVGVLALCVACSIFDAMDEYGF